MAHGRNLSFYAAEAAGNHSLDLMEVALRGNTGAYVKLALCTDQSRTPDIPILLRRLGLAVQIDLTSTRVTLEVKVWAKTRSAQPT